MKRALINIDYTNDFVAECGALTCGKPGQSIESAIYNISNEFIANGDLVIFAVDLHRKDEEFHPESKLFPPHNIEGTDGRLLYRSLHTLFEMHRDNKNVLWLDKTRYSAFTGTNLELILRERGILELHLVGVCTDICVLHTAVEAYNKGFKIIVHKESVASFNPTGHKWALDHFKSTLGADVR